MAGRSCPLGYRLERLHMVITLEYPKPARGVGAIMAVRYFRCETKGTCDSNSTTYLHTSLLTKGLPLVIPQPASTTRGWCTIVLLRGKWCSPGRSTTIAAVCPGASHSVTTWGANSPAATRAHAKSWRPADYHCHMTAASPSSWAAAELCPDWPRTARLRFDKCPWRSSGGSSSCARGAPTNSAHNTRPSALA